MQRTPDDTKPIKVQLPIRQHVKLHSLRILTALGISDMVQIAVSNYLEMVEEDGDIDEIATEEQMLGG